MSVLRIDHHIAQVHVGREPAVPVPFLDRQLENHHVAVHEPSVEVEGRAPDRLLATREAWRICEREAQKMPLA